MVQIKSTENSRIYSSSFYLCIYVRSLWLRTKEHTSFVLSHFIISLSVLPTWEITLSTPSKETLPFWTHYSSLVVLLDLFLTRSTSTSHVLPPHDSETLSSPELPGQPPTSSFCVRFFLFSFILLSSLFFCSLSRIVGVVLPTLYGFVLLSVTLSKVSLLVLDWGTRSKTSLIWLTSKGMN